MRAKFWNAVRRRAQAVAAYATKRVVAENTWVKIRTCPHCGCSDTDYWLDGLGGHATFSVNGVYIVRRCWNCNGDSIADDSGKCTDDLLPEPCAYVVNVQRNGRDFIIEVGTFRNRSDVEPTKVGWASVYSMNDVYQYLQTSFGIRDSPTVIGPNTKTACLGVRWVPAERNAFGEVITKNGRQVYVR